MKTLPKVRPISFLNPAMNIASAVVSGIGLLVKENHKGLATWQVARIVVYPGQRSGFQRGAAFFFQ